MPVYEIKRPDSPPRPETADRVPTPPVDGVSPVIRIRHYEGGRPKQESEKKSRAEPHAAAEERELRQLIGRVNANLERQNIPVHLVVLTAAEGFLIEVYDCTDRQVCRAVRDLEIRVAELPAVLSKLQREAGLLVDTIF